MKDRDILAELRAWRDEFARSHGYDLKAIAATLSKLDRASKGGVVRGTPRRPEEGLSPVGSEPITPSGKTRSATDSAAKSEAALS